MRLALETDGDCSHEAGATAVFGPLSAGYIHNLAGRYGAAFVLRALAK